MNKKMKRRSIDSGFIIFIVHNTINTVCLSFSYENDKIHNNKLPLHETCIVCIDMNSLCNLYLKLHIDHSRYISKAIFNTKYVELISGSSKVLLSVQFACSLRKNRSVSTLIQHYDFNNWLFNFHRKDVWKLLFFCIDSFV